MKILIPLVLLLQMGTAQSSLIGIMDSGTDISHNDLAPKIWFNPNERAGTEDLDQDGLPGDINGWDFIAGTPAPFDPQYNHLIDEDVKKFFYLYSKKETGTANSDDLAWIETHKKDAALLNKLNFVGGYIHGTHVAGISAAKVPDAKILSMKIIPTVYEELAPGTPEPLALPANALSTLTIPELVRELKSSAAVQVAEMASIHGILKFHKVDVVNQSFGIGFEDAVNFIKSVFTQNVGRAPTYGELYGIVQIYLTELLVNGKKMYDAAPNTMFVIAAGNDSSNNDLFPDYPANIQAENKLVVAATRGYSALADFSNFGATKVDVAAPGVAIVSAAPTNTHIPLSGTSQATPFVTNTIAQMKDINPNLSISSVKAIVMGTVDVKSWLAGKVKSSGIVNKERAKRAALHAKTMDLKSAIAKARSEIKDVLVNKSLNNLPVDLDSWFKPIRPSLLIKKVN